MNKQSNKTTGWALLLGSFLMFITMILHPTGGGGFEGLLRHANFAIIAHALAIFSIPFSAVGFFGLAQRLDESQFLSRLALAMMLLGLVAAMLAAALNGLAQPMFALQYEGADETTIDTLRPIFRYNMALNHAFDYILIAGMFFSTFLWSIAILRTQASAMADRFSKWLGYLGIALFVIGLISIVSGFYFLDLHGFRIFIFGWLIWIVSVGGSILRK